MAGEPPVVLVTVQVLVGGDDLAAAAAAVQAALAGIVNTPNHLWINRDDWRVTSAELRHGG